MLAKLSVLVKIIIQVPQCLWNTDKYQQFDSETRPAFTSFLPDFQNDEISIELIEYHMFSYLHWSAVPPGDFTEIPFLRSVGSRRQLTCVQPYTLVPSCIHSHVRTLIRTNTYTLSYTYSCQTCTNPYTLSSCKYVHSILHPLHTLHKCGL